MPYIRPITELQNTNEVSELCHREKEPVFITKNGHGDLVVMNIETYEHQQALMDIYKRIGEAELQEANGVIPIDGEAVFDSLRLKYGYR